MTERAGWVLPRIGRGSRESGVCPPLCRTSRLAMNEVDTRCLTIGFVRQAQPRSMTIREFTHESRRMTKKTPLHSRTETMPMRAHFTMRSRAEGISSSSCFIRSSSVSNIGNLCDLFFPDSN